MDAAREIATVTLVGEWDLSRQSEIRTIMERARGIDPLIVDLSHVQYMDSTMIRELVAFVKTRNGLDAPRIVAPSSGRAAKLFRLASLDDYFDLYESIDEASSV